MNQMFEFAGLILLSWKAIAALAIATALCLASRKRGRAIPWATVVLLCAVGITSAAFTQWREANQRAELLQSEIENYRIALKDAKALNSEAGKSEAVRLALTQKISDLENRLLENQMQLAKNSNRTQ
jgi:hypothetical protein